MRAAVLAVLITSLGFVADDISPDRGSPRQAQSVLRVISISAGPSGSDVNGTFALSEERSVFSREADREVYVLFRWEGVPGPHKLVAQWRSPDGSASSSSTIDYVAKDKRFGAYWQLGVTPSMALGVWSIDATVDGQPGGRHTFELRDARVAAAAVKRPLPQPELYARLNRVFVSIERTTSTGKVLDAGGGLLSNGALYTSIGVLDGVAGVRGKDADGRPIDITGVLGTNREDGSATLAGGTPSVPALPSPESAPTVGDRCYSIESSPAGGHALTSCSIIGRAAGAAGDRGFIVRFTTAPGTPGAPVVNEYGELLGLVGGGSVASPVFLIGEPQRGDTLDAALVPIVTARTGAPGQAQTLAALQASGVIYGPLVGDEHVVSGGFAAKPVKTNTVPPGDQRESFSTRDEKFVVFVNWLPTERLKGTSRLRLYDPLSRPLAETPAAKADLKKSQLTLTWWQLSVPPAPGSYRVEVLLNDRPVWRGTLRITP